MAEREAVLRGGFCFVREVYVTPPDAAPRTNVYVDRFNLYHGCFKSPDRYAQWRQYKWLDVSRMINLLFPRHQIKRIRYFTARVIVADNDLDQPTRQDAYLRALATIPNLTVHEGRFSVWVKSRILADPAASEPTALRPVQRVRILQPEEKGSDVNLASHLLVDAFHGEFDLAIVVSNDSDLAEPIRLVRSETGRRVAIVNPRTRMASDCQGLADEYRQIRFGIVRASQFPDVVTDADGREIHKPATWY